MRMPALQGGAYQNTCSVGAAGYYFCSIDNPFSQVIRCFEKASQNRQDRCS
jgi:hypothetical protein